VSDRKGDKGKPKLPEVLKSLGREAIERHEKRSATPEIEIGSKDGQWTFASPYNEDDLDEWQALLFEAFATRSAAAFHAFTSQLAQLCHTDWHGEGVGWLPRSWELRAAIQIVRSVRPRNEAEAALAAQMVAVHLMQMKLSAQALQHSYPDPRTCAIAGKLARTYATQLEMIAKLRGKGSRQRITVRKYSRHEHKHIHLHQGGDENGDQPHEPRGTRPQKIRAAIEPSSCSTVLGSNSPEYVVSEPGCEGEASVSTARRRGRVGGAKGHR
jgi:hypothetical protein